VGFGERQGSVQGGDPGAATTPRFRQPIRSARILPGTPPSTSKHAQRGLGPLVAGEPHEAQDIANLRTYANAHEGSIEALTDLIESLYGLALLGDRGEAEEPAGE